MILPQHSVISRGYPIAAADMRHIECIGGGMSRMQLSSGIASYLVSAFLAYLRYQCTQGVVGALRNSETEVYALYLAK